MIDMISTLILMLAQHRELNMVLGLRVGFGDWDFVLKDFFDSLFKRFLEVKPKPASRQQVELYRSHLKTYSIRNSSIATNHERSDQCMWIVGTLIVTSQLEAMTLHISQLACG